MFPVCLARPVLLLVLLLGLPAAAQPASAPGSGVHATWYKLALELVRHTPGYAPPVASRSFAYLGVAFHEAVAPGDPGARSLAGQLPGLERVPQPSVGAIYDWPAVAHGALARMTAHLFANTGPSGKNALRSVEGRLLKEVAAGLPADVLERSVAHGRAVADAVHAWSLSDGGAQGAALAVTFGEEYTLSTGEASWVSTSQTYPRPLLPFWGRNRTFVLRAADECPLPPPPAYSEAPGSQFHEEALEVHRTAQGLTPEQREIARFWADDAMLSFTPPGHWVAILGGVLEERGANLFFAAEAQARLGIALADSFIGCWHAKYEHNLLRPVSYIQRLIAPDWEPLLATPPFPEYPSGHSVQSAAAAEVLTGLFGENVAFTDRSKADDGFAPRAYPSFRAAAEEAALSRLYGGIHFRAAIERGLEMGRCVGTKVERLSFRR